MISLRKIRFHSGATFLMVVLFSVWHQHGPAIYCWRLVPRTRITEIASAFTWIKGVFCISFSFHLFFCFQLLYTRQYY